MSSESFSERNEAKARKEADKWLDTSYEPDYTDPESIIKEPIIIK